MTIKIAIDVMGGDNAPQEIIDGALLAAAEYQNLELLLVGKPEVMPAADQLPPNVSIVAAATAVAMDESVENLRHKQDSSIWVATKLVSDGTANAIVSAGSTGAQMASALMLLKRIKGISRPAIAVILPLPEGGKVVMDTGANVAVTPQNLLQFAQMGSIYAQCVFGHPSPRVALLSNGTEEHKGTELVQQAHQLLRASNLNFVGNLEGRDVTVDKYDVMVTDGFTGNVVIKVAEGVSSMLFGVIKTQLMTDLRSKMGAALVKPALHNVKKMLDYSEHGGAPLLGVNGISIVCHGSSNACAIKNAIRVAATCVEADFIQKIEQAAAENQ